MKIKWISSWRLLPQKVREPSVKAYHDPRTDTIYAIRGVTTRAEIEHEKYHSKKKHPDYPRNPARFVMNEINAYYYAYNRVGEPKHILVKLRGIHNDLVMEYRLRSQQATKMIVGAMAKLPKVPKGWISDIKELAKTPPIYKYTK